MMDMVKSVKLDEALGLHGSIPGSHDSLTSKACCQSDADSLAMPMAHANLATKFGQGIRGSKGFFLVVEMPFMPSPLNTTHQTKPWSLGVS